MRRCSGLLLLAAALIAVPSGAFADAQIINFSCIMQYCHNVFVTFGTTFYDPTAADWTVAGGVGILDVEEFKLLAAILADPSAPNHEAIHAAFTLNAAKVRSACGTTIINTTTSSATSGDTARQAIPGTDPVKYYGVDGLMGAYLTMGEWELYDTTMVSLRTSVLGSKVSWAEDTGLSEAKKPTYDLSQANNVNMCGDCDGDGAKNCNEYWAASPFSYINAINPAVTAVKMNWSAWTCLDENNSSVRFVYNAATQRVYTTSPLEITWAEALAYTLEYPGGSQIPVSLVTINNEAENTYVKTLGNGNTVWIGATDAGHDTGSASPNPDDWYWLSDPTESPMVYRNWRSGEPNGVNGSEDFGSMRSNGTWNDLGGATRTYYAVFSTIDTYADEDSNGAPDMFEDKNNDLVPDGFGVAKPTADFSGTPLTGGMPLVVTFTDASTVGAGEPAITAWAWDFGNGQTSTLQNPAPVTYMADDPSSSYTVSLAVTNSKGTTTKIRTNYITVQYVCEFAGALNAQGPALNDFIAAPASIGAGIQALLDQEDVEAWEDWDVEGLEALVGNPAAVVGDGLIDAAQIALVAEVVCNTRLDANASVYADMAANKALFLADLETLDATDDLAEFADIFAALLGLSAEMKATANEMVSMMAGADLPSLASYVIFDGEAKAGELFAADGDLDGDGETNLEEWENVVAVGGGISLFVDAASDPYNLWPGNPDLPVAGIVGLGLLAGGMLMSAAFALRKK